MASTTLSITITTAVMPPLGSDLAKQVGAEVAAHLHGTLVSRGDDDRGWHYWQLALDHDDNDPVSPRLSQLEESLHGTVPALHHLRVTSVEALTMDEVHRRLAAHGVPRPGQVRAPAGPPPQLPAMPDVVTTEQFARDVLDPPVDPSRVRQLRAEAEQARAEEREHPFPAEFLPGYWLRADAERYAAEGRRGPGRPRKAPE